MINFNFNLTDEDAEMLFDCIQSEIVRLLEGSYLHSEDSEEYKIAIRAQINRLNNLKEKLSNSKIK